MDQPDELQGFVVRCARCGENHRITWKKFKNNPIIDRDGITWNYWGMCPNTKEPVLLLSSEKV